MRIQMRKRGMRFVAFLTCSLISGVLMTQGAAGQSGLGSGRIEGTVTDESGATVAGATITARNDATGRWKHGYESHRDGGSAAGGYHTIVDQLRGWPGSDRKSAVERARLYRFRA